MRRILLDTNILLDVFLERKPFVQDAVSLIKAVEQNRIQGCVSLLSVAVVHYVVRKQAGTEAASSAVDAMADTFLVAMTSSDVLKKALAVPFRDFEDALQAAVAVESGCEAIITRNSGDFRGGPLPAFTASEYLARLSGRP
jgi:predicted nucleic acid-binding protein